MNRVRTLLVMAGLVLALAVVNIGIARRESLLRSGETVLLALAPVDPRSLMQGDYMALDFAIAADIRAAMPADSDASRDGYAILALDGERVASVRRIQDQALPRAGDELALRYRLRSGRVRIVTNAWFFAEGQAERYDAARFGELRVGDDGDALLVAMRDASLQPL